MTIHSGICRRCDKVVECPYIQFWDQYTNEKVKTCSDKCYKQSIEILFHKKKLLEKKEDVQQKRPQTAFQPYTKI